MMGLNRFLCLYYGVILHHISLNNNNEVGTYTWSYESLGSGQTDYVKEHSTYVLTEKYILNANMHNERTAIDNG